jgi:peptide/nickel transport system ATP-binding protein
VTPSERVRVDNLHVRFAGRDAAVHAVRGVSLSIKEGEAIGLVGESGSGKSTVARTIVGLVPPSGGSIAVGPDVVADAGRRVGYPRALRWKVQMIFQDPYSSLDPRQTGAQAVAEAIRRWRRISRRGAQEEALSLLRSVGISQRQATGPVHALSGGQRQRVSVARALAPSPELLIADEPTSALDQSAQAGVLNLLRTIQQERGLAILFISHDLNLVRYLTSQVHVMQGGVVVETGPTAQVLHHPSHEYTRKLVESVLA